MQSDRNELVVAGDGVEGGMHFKGAWYDFLGWWKYLAFFLWWFHGSITCQKWIVHFKYVQFIVKLS